MIPTTQNLHLVADGLVALKGDRATTEHFRALFSDVSEELAQSMLEWARNRARISSGGSGATPDAGFAQQNNNRALRDF